MKIMLFVLVLALLATPVFSVNGTNEAVANETDVTAVEGNASFVEEEVGALPGDLGYGFQRFFENVDLFFTLDKAEKAKKHAKFGKLRAVEAHAMTKKYQQLLAEGKEAQANETLEVVEQLTEEQNSEMEAAQQDLEGAVAEGTADEEDVEEVGLQLRNSIMVLQRVYEKVPESAKDGVLRALNNSIMNQERHEQKVAEKVQQKEEKKNKGNESQVQNEAGENESESSSGNGKGNSEVAQNKTKEVKENSEKSKGKPVDGSDDNESEDEAEENSED